MTFCFSRQKAKFQMLVDSIESYLFIYLFNLWFLSIVREYLIYKNMEEVSLSYDFIYVVLHIFSRKTCRKLKLLWNLISNFIWLFWLFLCYCSYVARHFYLLSNYKGKALKEE